MAFEFECSCGWRGTDPSFDAHLNAWCPRCGKPAEFSELAKMRRAKTGG
jgi:hypothetical protein